MVSLRAQRQQAEIEQRKQRIEHARRLGSQIGVESARRYVALKNEQQAQVEQALRSRMEEERKSMVDSLQHLAEEGQLRRGEGMRNAQAHMEVSLRQCEEEMRAWEAERQLERERYDIALERKRLEAKRREQANAIKAERRLAVKEKERDRSRAVLEGRTASAQRLLTSRGGGGVELLSLNEANARANNVVSIHRESGLLRGADAAKLRAEELQEERSAKELKALHEQRKAAERAKQVVKEMKAREEQRRLDDEQEALLRQSMAANAMRSSLRPVAATDFQEQEARKAQTVQRKAESDFESIFLRGPWSADSIRRFHDDQSTWFVAGGSVLERSGVEVLNSGSKAAVVSLAAQPLRTMELVATQETLPCEEPGCGDVGCGNSRGALHDAPAAASHGEGTVEDLNDSVDNLPTPQPSASLPQPTPKSPSPPQRSDVSEVAEAGVPTTSGPLPTGSLFPAAGVQEREDDEQRRLGATSISGAPASSLPENPSGSSSYTNPPSLRQQQEQFLKDLESLQLRLARAAQPATAVANATGDAAAKAHLRPRVAATDDSTLSTTATTAEGDMSISSMSSAGVESDRVVYATSDTAETSLDGSLRAAGGGRRHLGTHGVGMTAEQLKDSLRRLKRNPFRPHTAAS